MSATVHRYIRAMSSTVGLSSCCSRRGCDLDGCDYRIGCFEVGLNIFPLGCKHHALPGRCSGSLVVVAHDVGLVIKNIYPLIGFRMLKLKSHNSSCNLHISSLAGEFRKLSFRSLSNLRKLPEASVSTLLLRCQAKCRQYRVPAVSNGAQRYFHDAVLTSKLCAP